MLVLADLVEVLVEGLQVLVELLIEVVEEELHHLEVVPELL